jgi:hypothetical protein
MASSIAKQQLQRDRQRVLDDLVRGLDERKATPADR